MIQTNHKLPSTQRLKSRKQIELLFDKGNAFTLNNLRVNYLHQTDGNGVRAAFSAPKRNFKKSVDRNRIKRLMKEVYRKQKSILAGHDKIPDLFLMVNYTGKELPIYATLYENMTRLLQKLNGKIGRP